VSLYLGIDGGATRTRAIIVRENGEVLGIGESAGSNYQSVGIDRARAHIDEAVSLAFDTALLPRRSVSGAFLGIAGVVTGIDRSIVGEIVSDLDLATTITVDHDIRIAHAGGLGGGEGIALIAGTGSSCYGRRADGRVHRAGGWGALLDDVGSGYWIGLEGLRQVIRSIDGRGPSTSLFKTLLRELGVDDPEDLLRLSGIDGLPKESIAALAPVVFAASKAGDDVATRVVHHGAVELSGMIDAVRKRLWDEREPWPIVVGVGGLLDGPGYRQQITPVPVPPMLPPVFGAALLAISAGGGPSGQEVIDRLRAGVRDSTSS